jgi:hypothetical protein
MAQVRHSWDSGMSDGRKSKRSESDDTIVAIIRIHERGKTIRRVVLCLTVVSAIWLIADAYVRVSENTHWLKVVATAIATILVVLAPLYLCIRRFRFYMKRDHQRTIELELKYDEHRETSGIKKDGVPPDDL